MPDIKKDWSDFSTPTYIEATSSTWTTLSGATEEYSDGVDLETNGYDGAHVHIEVDFDPGPTDHVKVKLYGSLDGSGWANIPASERVIDNGTDPSQLDVVVKGLAHFRIGTQQTGAVDSHNVRIWYKAWKWNASV